MSSYLPVPVVRWTRVDAAWDGRPECIEVEVSMEVVVTATCRLELFTPGHPLIQEVSGLRVSLGSSTDDRTRSFSSDLDKIVGNQSQHSSNGQDQEVPPLEHDPSSAKGKFLFIINLMGD